MSTQFSTACSAEEIPSPVAAMEDDLNDGDDLAVQNNLAFVQFEAQLPSRFIDIFDLDSRRQLLGQSEQDCIEEQLRTVNTELRRTAHETKVHPDDNVDGVAACEAPEEFEEFEPVCNSVRNDHSGSTFSALFSTASWAWEWLESATALNRLFEKQYQHDDTASCTQEVRREKSHRDDLRTLYEILSSRTRCGGRTHSALVRVPVSIDSGSASLDMHISVCSQSEEGQTRRDQIERWHEITFNFDKPKQHHRDVTNVCSEVQYARDFERRLCLSFNQSMIWSRKDGEQRRVNSALQPIHLGIALREDRVAEDTLKSEHKKAKIALDLVQSLSYLYPGPWVQHLVDSTVVRFVPSLQGDRTETYGRVYFHCNILQDWISDNDVWKNFQDSQDEMKKPPTFFLSLAELLLQILTSEAEWPAAEARHTAHRQDWWTDLRSKVDKLEEDPTLHYYVKSILGCLDFAFDYTAERREHGYVQGATESARNVFVTNILNNLKKHYRTWDRQLQIIRSSNDPNHTRSKTSTSLTAGVNKRRQGKSSRESFYTLFATDDENFEDQNSPDQCTTKFIELMRDFKEVITDSSESNATHSAPNPIRIAVLDTGFTVDKEDPFFYGSADKRVNLKLSKNFLGDDPNDLSDKHGHGTHIVRLLLSCTVNAEIVILKISNDSTLQRVRLEQLTKALEHAGKHADIINLSFGLGVADSHKVRPIIDHLVKKNKLIFAAASNSGANGRRAFPARQEGVFAIHALRGDGSSPGNINPPPEPDKDNFATLGCGIPSWWKGREILITGTSYATPIAVAIAANLLEFIQAADEEYQPDPRHFWTYSEMRQLLSQLAGVSGSSNYTPIQPWKDGMFGPDSDIDEMQKLFRNLRVYGRLNQSSREGSKWS